ncbi:TPA: outer membrane protein assembly factor BamC [Neisseria meningitidis]
MTYIKPIVVALALISMTACSGSKKEQPKLDYQSQSHRLVKLEVPPDLNNPDQGNLYQLPAGSGAVRASDFNKRRTQAVQQPANAEVLKSVKGVRLERDGNQRWLVVDGKSPREIWPLLKVFWQENGFDIKSEEPAIGQMETEWAENRAKIPQDSLRRLLDKVGLGGIYSTSERDKFIIRIEQGKNGATDIFFAHKGMKEVYADRKKDTTMWQPGENDPNLEAAFLARFMQYLGVDGQQAENASAKKPTLPAANEMARIEGKSLIVFGDYGRNWRRTVLALDRIGLTVVGQNTERHAFLVQKAPNESNAVTEQKPGLFKRLLGKGKAEKPAEQPELIVYAEPVANGSRIVLLNKDGSAYAGKDASALLGKLHSELR